MNNLGAARRAARKILDRNFGDKCPSRVAQNRRRAEMVLGILEEPVSEADRQGVLAIVGRMDDPKNKRLATFNCTAAPDRTKRNRRNARDIRKALPDLILPSHPGPDIRGEIHTDMLKAFQENGFIAAGTPSHRMPGYSEIMTLAALYFSEVQFEKMLRYFRDMQYRSVVFYVDSGTNMRLFSRPDFSFWDDHEHIVRRVERIIDAGMTPIPCMMPNNGAPPWPVLYPKIRSLLDNLSERELIHSVLFGIEVDKNFNNSNRSPEDVAAGKDWFGIRQCRDTLGGDDLGGLKSSHYPHLFWLGHTTHIWLNEHGKDETPNYAGPQSYAGMQNSTMYPWFDGILHQPNGQWGRRVGDIDWKIKEYSRSWRAGARAIQRDGATPMLFEHSQEPWFHEHQAWTCADALLAESAKLGLNDSFGTGRRHLINVDENSSRR
jgi:hypothetical protein